MAQWQTPTLGITLRLHQAYEVVLELVIARLNQAGFVVQTEIDIQETLKRKLNVDSLPFRIVRVFNPALTARANLSAPDLSLLPYNITIAQMEDSSVEISIVDPLSMLTVMANPVLQPFVTEAHASLQRLANELQESH